MRGASWLIVGGLSLTACGGEAELELSRRSAAIPPPSTHTPDAGAAAGGSGGSSPTAPGDEEPPPFRGPVCPDVPPPPPMNECDPLSDGSECPAGESCFPFVDYPRGPCDVERYGAVCLASGSATQGEPCSDQACAAGHICVSTGRGTQCARLCGLADGAPEVCAPGLLCLPIDIEGFGGCL